MRCVTIDGRPHQNGIAKCRSPCGRLNCLISISAELVGEVVRGKRPSGSIYTGALQGY